MNAAHWANSLLLLGVIAVALVMGVIGFAPLGGLSGAVTASITGFGTKFGPALIWISVVASGLTLGIIYSFFHGKWQSRSAPTLLPDYGEPASAPDGTQ